MEINSKIHIASVIHLDLKNNPILNNIKKAAIKKNCNETLSSRKTHISSNAYTQEITTIRGPQLTDPSTSRCKPIKLAHSKTESSINKTTYKLSKSNSQISSIIQRSYLMYNVIQGKNHKLFQILKETSNDCLFCYKQKLTDTIIQKNFLKKYVATHEQYNSKVIDDIIVNENTHFSATFKDYLIFDDTTEFFKRFYNDYEIPMKYEKIYNCFYKEEKFLPKYESFIGIKKIMRLNIEQKKIVRNKILKEISSKAAKVFDTKFMAELNSSMTANSKSEKLMQSHKESVRLSKLLDVFLSKDNNSISKLNPKTCKNESPKVKAELRLDKTLAMKLGFNTNREDICIIPIDDITKIKMNPRNELVLTTKSRAKYSMAIT